LLKPKGMSDGNSLLKSNAKNFLDHFFLFL
jgi:hypothetical protein